MIISQGIYNAHNTLRLAPSQSLKCRCKYTKLNLDYLESEFNLCNIIMMPLYIYILINIVAYVRVLFLYNIYII